MKTKIIGICLLIAGCASGPVPPDWKINAHDALKTAGVAYAAGNHRLAGIEYARALTEIARTAKLDLYARAILTRCAVRLATLELDNCDEFLPHARDAGSAERAYADFLAGRWATLDPARLPGQYRPLFANPKEIAAALNDIADPMSRLIAAGVLFRMNRITPAAMKVAASTASDQGWSKALLAWLTLQARHALDSGDLEENARLLRRIEMVSGMRLAPH